MRIDAELIDQHNQLRSSAHDADYHALAEHLRRKGVDIHTLLQAAMQFGVAIPSWGLAPEGHALHDFRVLASRDMYSTSLTIAAGYSN